MDEPLEITEAELDLPKQNFSRLAVGTVLTRGDLMHLALMSSENRAAHALGANYPGGLHAFVGCNECQGSRARHAQRAFCRPDAACRARTSRVPRICRSW